jgi:hypothetical protein
MTLRGALKWGGLALLGIAIAIAVAFAASGLVSRQIGLASEPISVGRELAPTVNEQRERPARAPAQQPTERPVAPTVPSPATAPSHSEAGHESGDGDSDD